MISREQGGREEEEDIRGRKRDRRVARSRPWEHGEGEEEREGGEGGRRKRRGAEERLEGCGVGAGGCKGGCWQQSR